MSIEESLDKSLEHSPELLIHEIILTKFISYILLITYNGKKYLLIPDHILTINDDSVVVNRNEELVKEILTHFSEQIIRDLFPTIPLDFS